ncbi:AarF/ABC1/UbiB kinase family protein [Nocardia huaxiensis]|uniref:AarF/ABC1/UbiB kinase family protein n=1 Tax=Nocardia huaxiensis TaxID=2755382 RepID=A0A7D6VFC3_9NOCA|nr:AarF/ABC1/UbiB kinase family protein [Nocardia huaxiensis]QLY33162.1 AarF/ABC1/UbiB kinase family protein [Nocardia huaxiensis]
MARDASDKKVPTSRALRTAALGRVAAGAVLRQAGVKVATVGRSEEKKKAVMDRKQAEAMKALVNGLGTMRGAALKIGQALSIVDGGIFPDEVRDDFQKALAKLRDSAPTVGFDKMRKLIETELGGKLSEHFAEFRETPIASASIGQVYRARLHDGREVCVKVQYPGIDKAVRADIKNMALFSHALKLIAPALDTAALSAEIRDRVEEELDYELEAQNQRAAARLFRGHPFIVVPDVVTALSGQRVLVTEFFDGRGFEDIKNDDQQARNRVAEIIFRFFCAGLLRYGQFSGDPHPGNFLVGADGRIAFLDFGLYKFIDQKSIEDLLVIQRAMAEGDALAVHRGLAAGGFLPDPDEVDAEEALPIVESVFGWLTVDEVVEITPEMVNDALANTIVPTGDSFNLIRKQSIPQEQMVSLRTLVMVMAVLGQLRAANNWHAIAREWQYNDAPTTELGRLEAESEWADTHVFTPARA